MVCYLQVASLKRGTRSLVSATKLDSDEMWQVAYALTELAPSGEAMAGELIRKAAG